MIQQPLLHEVLAGIVSSMMFPISYTTAVDSGNGIFTLSGVPKLEHLQPGFSVTIGGNSFVVSDYTDDGCHWIIKLKAGTHSLPAAPGTFELYKPFFFHGTPVQQEAELTKTPLDKKTPMIYLMEPYQTKLDYSFETSIDSRSKVTLCFLTQADIPKWLTDDFYHNAINPMNRLVRHFINALIKSNLFYNIRQSGDVTNHTKFGINIKEYGTKKLYMSENLSGPSLDIILEMYRLDDCDCNIGNLHLAGDYNDDYPNDFYN